MTLPHEFIFVFIWKFIGRHCWKGLAKRGGVQKKKKKKGGGGATSGNYLKKWEVQKKIKKGEGGGNIWEVLKKGGSNLLHTMLLMFSTIVSLYLCMFYAHQKLKALLLLHVMLHRMFSRSNSLLTYPLSEQSCMVSAEILSANSGVSLFLTSGAKNCCLKSLFSTGYWHYLFCLWYDNF